MPEEQKYKIEKSYSIFERVGGKLIEPITDNYGRDQIIFSTYDSEEEAMEDILTKGYSFTDYLIIPSFRKVDFE